MPSPSVWGTVFHDSMMFMALSYPENPSDVYQNETEKFFRMFMDRLPCYACRVHARAFVARNPPKFESSSKYVDYLIAFHNDINARSGKKSDWKREEVLPAFYRRFYSNLAQLPQAELKRKEDHALMKQVLDGKTCSCKIAKEVQTREEKETPLPRRREEGSFLVRPIVLESNFCPDTSEDYAWIVLLLFLLLFLGIIVYLAVRLYRTSAPSASSNQTSRKTTEG
jgi:hypothetical protein